MDQTHGTSKRTEAVTVSAWVLHSSLLSSPRSPSSSSLLFLLLFLPLPPPRFIDSRSSRLSLLPSRPLPSHQSSARRSTPLTPSQHSSPPPPLSLSLLPLLLSLRAHCCRQFSDLIGVRSLYFLAEQPMLTSSSFAVASTPPLHAVVCRRFVCKLNWPTFDFPLSTATVFCLEPDLFEWISIG